MALVAEQKRQSDADAGSACPDDIWVGGPVPEAPKCGHPSGRVRLLDGRVQIKPAPLNHGVRAAQRSGRMDRR